MSTRSLKHKGRKPGSTNISTREAKDLAERLLTRPQYLRRLEKKLDEGTLHPSIEALLYYYRYGKPKEVIENTQPATVKIIHEYATPAGAPTDADSTPGTEDV